MLRRDEASRPWVVTIFCLPLVLSLVLVEVKVYGLQAYHDLIQEDSLLENLHFTFTWRRTAWACGPPLDLGGLVWPGTPGQP